MSKSVCKKKLNSTTKSTINTWYLQILTKSTKYLSKKFCNLRDFYPHFRDTRVKISAQKTKAVKKLTYRFVTSRTDFGSTPLGFSICDLGPRIAIRFCHHTTFGSDVGFCLVINVRFHRLEWKKYKDNHSFPKIQISHMANAKTRDVIY